MSCAQVMYHPYSSYFPYQRSVAASAAAGSPSTSVGASATNIGHQTAVSAVDQKLEHAHEFPTREQAEAWIDYEMDHTPPPQSSGTTHTIMNSEIPVPETRLIGLRSTSAIDVLDVSPDVPAIIPETQPPENAHLLPTKYVSSKLGPDALGPEGSPECNVTSLSPPSLSSASSATGAGVQTKEEPKEKNMHFVSSNCVVFTYYTGDISTVVDEHFSRALSQPSSYSPEPNAGKNPTLKDAPPMSQRNFPPSFWNSNHQPTTAGLSALGGMTSASHNEVPYPAEAYHTAGALHSIHQGDPWHYTLSSHAQATGHHYTHRPSVHDLSYSGMPSSRFSPQYSSLLLQPSVRTARLPPCGGLDKGDTWPTSRYHEPLTHVDANYGPTYSAMGAIPGLESQVQEPSKDLYWF